MTDKKIRMATPESNDQQGHTIVGGRPQAPRSMRTDIPRGLEILIKKASVDPEFKAELLKKREKFAEELNIQLDASEAAMLACVPVSHLEKMIQATEIPQAQQKMLAGASTAAIVALIAQLALAPVPGKAADQVGNDSHTTSLQDNDALQLAILPDNPDSESGKENFKIGVKTGIRPDAPASTAPLAPAAIFDSYDDHLADRGARPDMPPISLEPAKVEPELTGSLIIPFNNEVRVNIKGMRLAEALAAISKDTGITIEYSGLDETSAGYPVESPMEGLPLPQTLNSICNEVANDIYRFYYVSDINKKTIKIIFTGKSGIPSTYDNDEPMIEPDTDSAICRGIRSDMPRIDKKRPGSDNGDKK
jgi:hypothetical protein